MINELISVCPRLCRGGFIAYWNDNPLYPHDPAAMFRQAIAVLLPMAGDPLVCALDLTQEAPDFSNTVFYPHPLSQFGTRSTGALFFKSCYFSIRTGDFSGSYQISEDYCKNEEFPNQRAYTKFLRGSKQ